ncbi:CpaF family protein [Alkaliphilus peptidifermentans]|uniref:Pilus assembly protein CpaF n=1 Tax=Alkaliphilus peptidifermentans DSM 18978 TaxID=1120976 RepID=A0A1G5J8J9_9FIRM|nr:CpaF family protein [Alkaliphilus peptidifermentans]SCY84524.1 pilus assembly protein CpaF [Alkaliphilus peptidifermentans DSM 18978]
MDENRLNDLIKEVKEIVRDQVDFNKDPTDDEIEGAIEEIVFDKSRDTNLGLDEKYQTIQRVFNDMRRLDILQPILEDPSVTEIMVNGTSDIFVEKEGKTHRLDTKFISQKKLEDIIQTIVAKVNRAVNEASPIVDARLNDGSRVNIVLPPIALNGPILTIRRFPEKPISMEQLIEYGSISQEATKLLKSLVKGKYNIFICGGTGSGKTTFLNALSNFIPIDERIITIEDSAELQITNVINLVRLETRNANTEGKGTISIRDLIKASLRMRPDRIIVGEVRGSEAIDMLQAMNTGHDGSLSTGHGNSNRDMLSRIETMVLSGAQLPIEAIRQQIASAIDIIIHLGRMRDKSRKVLEISEVVGYHKGEILLNPLYHFKEAVEASSDRLEGSLVSTGNGLKNSEKLKLAGLPLLWE